MEGFRITVLGLLWVLILLTVGSVSGQMIEGVSKGERVKITYESSTPRVVVGLLHDVLENAFLVAPTATGVVPIPRDQVTDFRVLRGQEREWKRGLLVGSISGAATGSLMYLLIDEAFDEVFGEGGSSSPGVLAYGALGALYGAGIGTGIGWFFKKDRWEPVAFGLTRPSSPFGPAERSSLGISIPLNLSPWQ